MVFFLPTLHFGYFQTPWLHYKVNGELEWTNCRLSRIFLWSDSRLLCFRPVKLEAWRSQEVVNQGWYVSTESLLVERSKSDAKLMSPISSWRIARAGLLGKTYWRVHVDAWSSSFPSDRLAAVKFIRQVLYSNRVEYLSNTKLVTRTQAGRKRLAIPSGSDSLSQY